MNSPFQFGSVQRSRYAPQQQQPWEVRGKELQSTFKEVAPEVQQSIGEKSADALALEQRGGTLMQSERQSLGMPTVYKTNYGAEQFQQDIGSKYAPVLKQWGVSNLQGQKGWIDPSKLQAVESTVTGLESDAAAKTGSNLTDYTNRVASLKSRYGSARESGLKNIRDWKAELGAVTQQSGAAQVYADNELAATAADNFNRSTRFEDYGEDQNRYAAARQDFINQTRANYVSPYTNRINELNRAMAAKRTELGI